MRFALTHKATTYALLAFAYLAMTAGGGIEPTIAILGGVGLFISWWWEPPIIAHGRWAWVWTIASILVLLYSALSAVATSDYLRVGAEFLVWLVVAKACNRATARDWLQLYLLAFLMLVAGSVLNADLTYGACFLGFVITSTWSLTLFQLRREMEDSFLLKHADDQPSERVQVRRILESRRIVGGRFLLGTAALSVGVFLGAAALFLALPRVGFGILGSRKGGLSMAGFSDGVRLGGHGVIKRDPTVVMRVEMPPAWGDRSAAAVHWRGVSFETYSMGIWTRTGKAPVTRASVTQIGVRRERRVLLYDRPRPNPVEMAARRAAAVEQNIYLDPLDTDVLFGASMPFVFETDTPQRSMRAGSERNDEVRMRRTGTVHYQVWSEMQPPNAAILRAADETLPRGFEVYLQLPNEITDETRELAQTITQGKTTRYDKAVALREWLTTNLGYTLEQKDPEEMEPVHFFLFERKKGHCEYFASAFAVLARAVGIPTRNVNGFLGGEWNEYDSYVAVRAGDAHSWAEVYFDGAGWVTFDATPPGQIDQLGRGDSGALARMQRFLDTLRFQWAKWVIEYDLKQQLSVFRGVGNVLRDGARAVKAALGAVWDAAKQGWPVAVVLGLGAALWWARRRRLLLGPAEGGVRRKASPVAAALLDAEKALARRGMGRDAATTPSEHAAELAKRGGAGAGTYGELVALHQRVVWGQEEGEEVGGDALAKAQELVAKLRRELAEPMRMETTARAG